ncbi:sensor histidine kinase [Planomonospora corallina]|uniref:histidine kinase n=1 Tax=Planomonospora corallina TaxID=1806052 RepID=A0ABV8I4H4_9ACTN
MSSGPAVPAAPAGPVRRSGFAARLLAAQGIVLVAMALTTWLVASAVGPGIFHDHLRRAGTAHTAAEAEHVDQAFTSAMLLSLPVALLAAVVFALAVTWYLSRRLQRSVARVAGAAAEVAAGDYGSRLPLLGLGGEFDRLAATFNALAEQLEAVESTRRRMLADLAHEMRTPLATLEAHIEALEDGVRTLDEDTFAVLRSSTGRLGRLAQDVSAVSRAEEGRLEVDPHPVDPALLVADAVRAAGERYRDKGVALRSQPSAGRPVLADAARMGQVLGNLLDNALRHTPPGGTVTVGCRAAGDWTEFEVRDTGEGIDPDHLAHVFDRFYRADPARSRAQGGSGIGLTITRALVRAHGGSIRAHSAGRGRGAVFTVRVPAAPRRER